jgi:hypothetical protein
MNMCVLVIFLVLVVTIIVVMVMKRICKYNPKKSKPSIISKSISESNKKAVLIGINKYRPDLNADLRGCVNDVETVRDLLIRQYGFNPDDIRLLIDERATQANIIERLEWLVGVSKPGDEVVFHYSGHGSQIRCREGDELSDGLDEIICPYDLNWDDPITDDMISEIFSKLPDGVNFTMISDSCHSSTMLRELNSCGADITYSKPRFIMPPLDIRSRSWNRDLSKRTLVSQIGVGNTVEKYVLLSGCKDDQTSADAFIDSKYMGALTWAFTKILNNNPDLSWHEMYPLVYITIKSGGYTQDPQLSGFEPLLIGKVFGGAKK